MLSREWWEREAKREHNARVSWVLRELQKRLQEEGLSYKASGRIVGFMSRAIYRLFRARGFD